MFLGGGGIIALYFFPGKNMKLESPHYEAAEKLMILNR